MKLAIISHTIHHKDSEGEIVGWGPTVREVNYLSGGFEKIVHVAPLHNGDILPGCMPYKSDSIEFVSVYVDSDVYPIEIERDSIPWTVITEDRGWGSEIVDLLNIQYIPFNILINPEGTIMLRNVPAQEVAEMVTKSSKD